MHVLGIHGGDESHLPTARLLLGLGDDGRPSPRSRRHVPEMNLRDMHGRTPYNCTYSKQHIKSNVNEEIKQMMKAETPVLGQCGYGCTLA
jgi:hypothetical protein